MDKRFDGIAWVWLLDVVTWLPETSGITTAIK